MKLLSIVGVRHQFVQGAMVGAAVERFNQTKSARPIRHILVNTGQHYETAMAEVFFRQLPLPTPDYSLGVGSGTHGAQTGAMLEKIEKVLLKDRPDFVIVYGDTNSTLAGALAAVKLHIPVAHVEAGLRSFNRYMPEEINRLLTDAIADLLFVTEESGRANLLREGIAAEKVHFVGNVMIDALQASRSSWERSSIASELGLDGQPYVVLTLHRPSNVDDPRTLIDYLGAFQDLARHVPVVFPTHPRVKAQLLRQGYLSDSGTPLHGKGVAYLH